MVSPSVKCHSIFCPCTTISPPIDASVRLFSLSSSFSADAEEAWQKHQHYYKQERRHNRPDVQKHCGPLKKGASPPHPPLSQGHDSPVHQHKNPFVRSYWLPYNNYNVRGGTHFDGGFNNATVLVHQCPMPNCFRGVEGANVCYCCY